MIISQLKKPDGHKNTFDSKKLKIINKGPSKSSQLHIYQGNAAFGCTSKQ